MRSADQADRSAKLANLRELNEDGALNRRWRNEKSFVFRFAVGI